jgi:hypothetical protein
MVTLLPIWLRCRRGKCHCPYYSTHEVGCDRPEEEITMVDEIRPYGPGKFDTILDAYVYGVTLQGGCDDECGDVSESGHWYGLMRGGSTIFQDHDPFAEPLNEAEKELLASSAGVVVSEDASGFVTVDYYDTDEALDAAWARVLRAEGKTNG